MAFFHYKRIGAALPANYRAEISRIFAHSGKKTIDVDEYLGSITIFSILVGLIFIIVPFVFQLDYRIFIAALSIPAVLLIHYLNYLFAYIGLEDYTRRIEDVLPDFLRLVSSNIRSGMTPFQALKLAARPEFGPLKDEVEYVTIRGLGNENFQELVMAINKHMSSESLDRVLKLFSSTIKSGGHLAQILEESSVYIEEKRRLKKELSTITKSYAIFIMFSVVIIAPFLLSISIQFLSMVTSIQSLTEGAENVAGFGGTVSISVDFLRIGALVFLIITGIFPSMLVAVINQEKMQYGFKYALVIVTLSVISFFGANTIIKSMFG